MCPPISTLSTTLEGWLHNLLGRPHWFQMMVKEDYWGLTTINYTGGRWKIKRHKKQAKEVNKVSVLYCS